MTPRSFFTILIKLLGLYLIIESVTVVPAFFSSLSTFSLSGGDSGQTIALTALGLLVTLIIYFIILRYLLFKSDWIIDKLHLDKGFVEEKFELNIHRTTVLSIAVIIIGSFIFVDSLTWFCKYVFGSIGFKQTSGRFGQTDNQAYYWIIFFVKTFIGYFMVSNHRLIVNLIERQRRK